MGALTADRPKPLLRLNGQPIIEHILRGLRAAGIREAVIVTGYRGAQIEAHLEDGRRLDMRLTYRRQHVADGTARALLLARAAVADAPFLLSWGDVLVRPQTYVALLDDFTRHACDALLTVNQVADPWRGAAVYVDAGGTVTRLVEKPPRGSSTTPWNNAGIFVFTPLILAYAARVPASPRGEYELPQALAAMIGDGRAVRAMPVGGFWSDVGTPEDLAAAERALSMEDPRA
jgi:NDP-sugar pyrophosphorylase family protein